MRFRWTIKELEEKSDLEILRGVLSERRSDCTNVYSPLSKKLGELYSKIDRLIKSGKSALK